MNETLSLLVIDLGESCVVKVERGDPAVVMGLDAFIDTFSDSASTHDVALVRRPFEDVKAALDGEKPVPRIEREDAHFRLYRQTDDGQDKDYGMLDTVYQALSQLAGHPLPIYEGGKWERLNTHDWTEAHKNLAEYNASISGVGYVLDSFSFEEKICPVKIWRYVR